MDDTKLTAGFYEQVINEYFAKRLEHIENRFKETEKIDQTEASTVLSGYLKDIVAQGLSLPKIRKKQQAMQPVCNGRSGWSTKL